MTSQSAAALELVRRGWSVFPLHANGKEPATQHGHRDATRDRDAVARWWRRAPDRNVGLATGAPSGVWVLDVDGALGAAQVAALEAEHGPLPDTAVVQTARGRHYYWSTPPGVRIRSRAHIAPTRADHAGLSGGLDVRGDGGYVVAPGSVHPSGALYLWLSDREPAEAPAWLVDLVAEPASAAHAEHPSTAPAGGEARVRKDAASSGPALTVADWRTPLGLSALETAPQRLRDAAPGTGNATLNREAHGLAACGVPRDEGEGALWPVWRLRKAEGGEGEEQARREFQKTFDSGYRSGLKAPARPQKAPPGSPRRSGPGARVERTRAPHATQPRGPRPTSSTPASTATVAAILAEARGEPEDEDAETSDAPSSLAADGNSDGTTRSRITRSKEGKPLATSWNVAGLLRTKAPGVLGYDLHTQDVIVLRAPPWWPTRTPRTYPAPLEQGDILAAGEWLQAVTETGFKSALIGEGMEAAARQATFDSFRGWLDGLTWDGVERLPSWLPDLMGTRNTTLAREFGRRWMISAVARTYDPGEKVDHVLVFEGEQGRGKSTALRVLATGTRKAGQYTSHLFSDAPIDTADKSTLENMTGVVIWEMGELSLLKRSQLEATKAFITRQEDRFRRPWAIRPIRAPRRTVFAATTNDEQYLDDSTGNRRWWPVETADDVRLDLIASTRDQLWAEAVARYRRGEAWHLDTPELVELQRRATERRRRVDPWETAIREYCVGREDGVSVEEVLTRKLEIPRGRQTKAEEMRAASILRNVLGLVRIRRSQVNVREFVYVPPDAQWKLNIGQED